MSEDTTTETPTESAAENADASPPAGSLISSFIKNQVGSMSPDPPKQEETDTAKESDPGADPKEPTKEVDPKDPFDGFGNQEKKEEEEEEPDSPLDEEDEGTDDKVDEDFPKGAKAWHKYKTKLKATYDKQLEEKIKEHSNERTSMLEAQLKEISEQNETLTREIEKHNLTASPAFRAKFTEPKAELINDIRILVDDDNNDGIKKLTSAMENGTLKRADINNLVEGLGDFERTEIYQSVKQWFKLNAEEQATMKDWQTKKAEFEVDSASIQQEQMAQMSKRLKDSLQHQTQVAITAAKERLPGYSDTDIAAVVNGLQSGDPLNFFVQSATALPFAKRSLVEVTSQRDQLASEKEALSTENADLKTRLSKYEKANNIDTKPSAPNDQTFTPENMKPGDGIRRFLNDNIQVG